MSGYISGPTNQLSKFFILTGIHIRWNKSWDIVMEKPHKAKLRVNIDNLSTC